MTGHYASSQSCLGSLELSSVSKPVDGSRSHASQQITPISLFFFALGMVALGLSAITNIRHATAHTTDATDAAILGGSAILVTCAFVFLPTVAAWAWRSANYGLVLIAVVGSVIGGGLSLVNVAGASLGNKLAVTATATDASEKRADARKRIDKAETEIAAIGSTRPPSAIQAAIDAKLATRADLDGCEGKWLPSSKARSVCIDVAQLRSEKATADRRTGLERQMAEARAVLSSVRSGLTVGSGSTVAVVTASAKLGVKIEGATVDLLSALATALVVELVAMASFMFASAITIPVSATVSFPAHSTNCTFANGTGPETAHDAGAGGVPTLDATALPCIPALDGIAPRGAVPACPDQDDDARAAVLAALVSRGGSVVASQRSMGDLFGVSKSSVNRVLKQLEVAGRVRLLTSSKGTAVELILADAA